MYNWPTNNLLHYSALTCLWHIKGSVEICGYVQLYEKQNQKDLVKKFSDILLERTNWFAKCWCSTHLLTKLLTQDYNYQNGFSGIKQNLCPRKWLREIRLFPMIYMQLQPKWYNYRWRSDGCIYCIENKVHCCETSCRQNTSISKREGRTGRLWKYISANVSGRC